ncbi:MAG: phosphoribosylanthranilate isomerase [Chloroflexi bacterium]|nr:phosphoribosylanthranilate isomerase [Chloroflexota bacterium]
MTAFKICGITRPAYAIAATDAGADFIGLLFAPSSRQLTGDQARDLVREARSQRPSIGQRPRVVGVFVNSPAEEINEMAEYCGLDWVQIHGDETLEDCSAIQRPILKVVRIPADVPTEELLSRLDQELGAIVERGYTPMLDSVSTGRYYGGTGRPFDWKVAADLAKKYRFVLSGGLSPENVAPAIGQIRPWGVDVSSGVETEGAKDIGKIQAFARAVAEADARLGSTTFRC